ncbi:ATP-binding protein [Bifidobacterium parmae]|nr:AAA family ATPase [Bifidobacterium parmae]
MLHRRAYDRLLTWKHEEQGASAILLEGARRVGKSTLATQFGGNEYRSYILIDFSNVDEAVLDLFRTQRTDLDRFFSYLSLYFGVTLYRRESLIIFDEVQFFPQARAFIKHLVADGRYDYIETGSLVSIRQNVEDILIPSEEDSLELNPLDFEEFLWAMDQRPMADAIRESFESKHPLPEAIHRKAMDLFREYMLIGGMPKPVADYADDHDFAQADKEKRRILSLYRKDVARFAKGYETKVLSIFDGLPGQLSKHEKRFSLASIGKTARMRDYEDSFFWLSDARITNNCYNSTDPHVGLRLDEDHTTLKCYMADTGLLVSHAFPAARNRTGVNSVYRDILFGKLELNEGMLVENIVAQQLKASGHDLFFYSRRDQTNAANTMEIDFLIQAPYANANLRLRVAPIEVKSTGRYGTKSLEKFKNKFGARVGSQIVLHPKQMRIDGDRMYLPLYMAHCL